MTPLDKMSVRQLKAELTTRGADFKGAVERSDLEALLEGARKTELCKTT